MIMISLWVSAVSQSLRATYISLICIDSAIVTVSGCPLRIRGGRNHQLSRCFNCQQHFRFGTRVSEKTVNDKLVVEMCG